MFVFDVAVKLRQRGLEDMRGGDTACGDSPPSFLSKQGCFSLSSGQTELSRVASLAPGRRIRPQGAQARGNVRFFQPINFRGFSFEHSLQPFRTNPLNGACTVLADGGDQAKRISGRDMETAPPVLQNASVVRQQTP